jgi:hypothetical protein
LAGLTPSAQRNLITAHCQGRCNVKWSVHVYRVSPSTKLTMVCCAMYVQTCQNSVKIGYNRSAATAFDTDLIHELPLLCDLPSYMNMLIVMVRQTHPCNYILLAWCQHMTSHHYIHTLPCGVFHNFFLDSDDLLTHHTNFFFKLVLYLNMPDCPHHLNMIEYCKFSGIS